MVPQPEGRLAPGAADYREGALCRLEDARALASLGRWAGAVYLGGRAVEAMLRALLWVRDSKQEIGHDLRELLKRAREAGLMDARDDALTDAVNELAVLWRNDLRFIGTAAFRRRLSHLRRLTRDVTGRRIRGDPVKANAILFLETCETVIARGEVVWHRSPKK